MKHHLPTCHHKNCPKLKAYQCFCTCPEDVPKEKKKIVIHGKMGRRMKINERIFMSTLPPQPSEPMQTGKECINCGGKNCTTCKKGRPLPPQIPAKEEKTATEVLVEENICKNLGYTHSADSREHEIKCLNTSTSPTDWEKEFDEKWPVLNTHNQLLGIGECTLRVKDFISSLLLRAREEGETIGQAKMNNSGRLLFQQGQKAELTRVRELIEKSGKTSKHRVGEYCVNVSDILSQL